MVLGEKHGTNYLPCTPFQKFSVEIFIHGKKNASEFRITQFAIVALVIATPYCFHSFS